MKYKLTDEQQIIYNRVNGFFDGLRVFSLDALAGSGKSFLCAYLCTRSRFEKVGVLTPTHAAADSFRKLIAKLQKSYSETVVVETIYSRNGFLPRWKGKKPSYEIGSFAWKRFDLLVIDEAATLNLPFSLRIIDCILNLPKKEERTILFTGDSCQLPPIKHFDFLSPMFELLKQNCEGLIEMKMSKNIRARGADKDLVRFQNQIRAKIQEILMNKREIRQISGIHDFFEFVEKNLKTVAGIKFVERHRIDDFFGTFSGNDQDFLYITYSNSERQRSQCVFYEQNEMSFQTDFLCTRFMKLENGWNIRKNTLIPAFVTKRDAILKFDYVSSSCEKKYLEVPSSIKDINYNEEKYLECKEEIQACSEITRTRYPGRIAGSYDDDESVRYETCSSSFSGVLCDFHQDMLFSAAMKTMCDSRFITLYKAQGKSTSHSIIDLTNIIYCLFGRIQTEEEEEDFVVSLQHQNLQRHEEIIELIEKYDYKIPRREVICAISQLNALRGLYVACSRTTKRFTIVTK